MNRFSKRYVSTNTDPGIPSGDPDQETGRIRLSIPFRLGLEATSEPPATASAPCQASWGPPSILDVRSERLRSRTCACTDASVHPSMRASMCPSVCISAHWSMHQRITHASMRASMDRHTSLDTVQAPPMAAKSAPPQATKATTV